MKKLTWKQVLPAFVLAASLSAPSAFSASVLGIKGGLALSKINSDAAATSSSGTGYLYGVSYDPGKKPIGFTFDVLVAQRAYGLGPNGSLKTTSIYLPMLVTYKGSGVLMAGFGGYLAYGIGDVNGASYEQVGLKKLDYGVVATVGLVIPSDSARVVIEGRYNYGLANVSDGAGTLKFSSIDFLVGLWF